MTATRRASFPLRYAIPAALALLTIAATAYVSNAERDDEEQRVRAGAVTALTRSATLILPDIEYLAAHDDVPELQRQLALATALDGKTVSLVLDEREAVVAASVPGLAGRRLDEIGHIGQPIPDRQFDDIVRQVRRARDTTRSAIEFDVSVDHVVGAWPVAVRLPGEPAGRPRVHLLVISEDIREALDQAHAGVERTAWRFGAFFLAVSAFLALAAHFMFARRLATLEEAAERVGAGDLDVRASLGGRDELSEIGAAFDQMIAGVSAARDALDAQRARAQRILDSLTAFVGVFSLDGRVTLVNRPALRALKQPVDEVIGRRVSDVLTGGRGRSHADVDRAIESAATGETVRLDVTVPTPRGPMVFDSLFGPLVGPDGRIVEVVACAVDITERRRVEEALRTREHFVQHVTDTMPSLLYVLDLESGGLVYVNGELERTLGYRPGDVTALGPKLVQTLLHPDDYVDFTSRLNRLAQLPQGQFGERVLRFRHAKGHYLWMLVRATPFDRGPDGRVRQMLGVAQDISAQRSLQDQLAHAQKMESIGRLAGGVAHDFNNLLTVITGFAQLSHDELPKDSALRENMEMVLNAASQASELTSHLLSFARKQMIDTRVVDIATLLADAERMLRRLIGEDVELHVSADAGVWPVQVDPGQLLQVVVNLAVNARDAMPNGGVLTIRALNSAASAPRPPGVPADGDCVVLSVADTGTGMTDDVKARLFEPFFTTKERGKGTGLGLAMCYGLVHQHGGHISVDTELGRGTRFGVWLPRSDLSRPELPVESSRDDVRLGGTERILVVEDNPLVRGATASALRAHGYAVYEAESGIDVIERPPIPIDAIDLLLTDVVMPRMSGPELTVRLRAGRPDLKVLFVSGYADETPASSGAAIEVFLRKPFTPRNLLVEVRRLLDRVVPTRPSA